LSTTEAARSAFLIDLLCRDLLGELEKATDEQLNRPVDVPEANSLFAIATHTLGANRAWILGFVGGRPVQRDRDAEFTASGSLAALREGFEEFLAGMHEVLDALPDAEMGRETAAPAYRPEYAGAPLTVRDCVQHMVDHTALHLGHAQVTRQLLQRS